MESPQNCNTGGLPANSVLQHTPVNGGTASSAAGFFVPWAYPSSSIGEPGKERAFLRPGWCSFSLPLSSWERPSSRGCAGTARQWQGHILSLSLGIRNQPDGFSPARREEASRFFFLPLARDAGDRVWSSPIPSEKK